MLVLTLLLAIVSAPLPSPEEFAELEWIVKHRIVRLERLLKKLNRLIAEEQQKLDRLP